MRHRSTPTSGAALLSFLPKAAGFVALFRVLGFVLPAAVQDTDRGVIGLALGRSIEHVVGCLAAWQAGAAFVPLDLHWPDDRIGFILAEARPERWDGSGLGEHAERISAQIKNMIGITARVLAVAPDTLERSAGKARRVRDKRPRS